MVVLAAPAQQALTRQPVDAHPSNVALARAFAALSDPTRCAVVELLHARPQRASDLAAALQIAPAGLSRHLRLSLIHI